MSRVIDISPRLGEYMLKGWVLTDRVCPTEACPAPLLRSPNGRPPPATYYCANCDADTTAPATATSPAPAVSETLTSPGGSSPHYSRPSTPPTEVSSGLSSPTFAPPVETAETRRRREQSDRASAEIGKKLLQGYAMLADECPNSRCYGVPLVRPPKTGPEKDPRKQCVVCGRTYVDERDAEGFEHMVVKPKAASTTATGPSSGSGHATPSVKDKGKEKEDSSVQAPLATSSFSAHRSGTITQRHAAPQIEDLPLPQSTNLAVQSSVGALEQALQALSQRMALVTSSHANMDVAAVGNIADSMSRAAQALAHVNNLRRSG